MSIELIAGIYECIWHIPGSLYIIEYKTDVYIAQLVCLAIGLFVGRQRGALPLLNLFLPPQKFVIRQYKNSQKVHKAQYTL